MAITTGTGLYPTWLDFFIHNPSVDDLNENANAVVRVASQNATSSVTDRFADASLFTDCCALAVSALPGHLCFVHHWQRIGNPILHPTAVKYVAINGIADHSELTITATPTAYDAMLPPADILPMTTPFAKTLPLDAQPPDVLSPAKWYVYINDIITVGLYLLFLTLRLLMTAAVAIYAIFRPLQTSESSIWDHPLSIQKLAGDGALAEPKSSLVGF